MATKIMQWVAIAALLASVARSASIGYQFLLVIVITVSALAVLTQALRATKPAWVAVFAVVVTFLNPALVRTMQPAAYLRADLICLAAFVASLVLLKNQRVLSQASMDRTPGRESL